MPASSSWYARNRSLLGLAGALFLLNQLLEFGLIQIFNAGYTQLCVWDCPWYQSLVREGYDAQPFRHERGDAANWAFFPVFPMLARALHQATGIPVELSLVLVSKFFFFWAILAFMRFGQAAAPRVPAALTGALLAFSPYAIYGNVGYTESLFLALTCAFFVLMREQRYVGAGLAAACLSAVRFVGGAASFIYVVFLWRRFLQADGDTRLRILLGALLGPLGLALFMIHLYQHTGDALAFSHIQRAWDREVQNPLAVLFAGLGRGWMERYLAMSALVALACAAWLACKREFTLTVYVLICTLVPLATGLVSLPRYVFWQAPVLLVLAGLLSWRRLWVVGLPLSLVGLVLMYRLWFAMDAFVI